MQLNKEYIIKATKCC